MVVYPPENLDAIPDRKTADIEAEVESFYEATAAVKDDLRDYSNRMSGSLPAEDLALFDALLLMLDSDSLVAKTVERIRGGNWAPGACARLSRSTCRCLKPWRMPTCASAPAISGTWGAG